MNTIARMWLGAGGFYTSRLGAVANGEQLVTDVHVIRAKDESRIKHNQVGLSVVMLGRLQPGGYPEPIVLAELHGNVMMLPPNEFDAIWNQTNE